MWIKAQRGKLLNTDFLERMYLHPLEDRGAPYSIVGVVGNTDADIILFQSDSYEVTQSAFSSVQYALSRGTNYLDMSVVDIRVGGKR